MAHLDLVLELQVDLWLESPTPSAETQQVEMYDCISSQMFISTVDYSATHSKLFLGVWVKPLQNQFGIFVGFSFHHLLKLRGNITRSPKPRMTKKNLIDS